jgi:hypothetical protein
MFAPGRGPWEVWLVLSDRWGRKATLVDLYELEAASRGIPPEHLSKADRSQLWAAVRPIRYPTRQPALSGSERRGDPHAISEYDPGWAVTFAHWRSRLAAALGRRRPGSITLAPPPCLALPPASPREVHVHVCNAEQADAGKPSEQRR